MPRLRRFAALLFLPLVLQLGLAAEARACVQQSATAAQGSESNESMPGMDMTGSSTSRDGSGPTTPRRAPCENPFGPGQCQALAPCGSAVVTPDTRVLVSFAPPAPRIEPLVVLAPTSRTLAPEPPPPRS